MGDLWCGFSLVLTGLVTATLSYRVGGRRRRRRRGAHRPAGGRSETMRAWPGRPAVQEDEDVEDEGDSAPPER